MITFITTQSILEKILLDKEETNPWHTILKKNKDNMQILLKYEDDKWKDDNYPLRILSSAQKIPIIHRDDDEYITNIMSNPKSVLEYPCGIFILDISEEEALQIQSDYGVIVQSIDKMDDTILTKPFENNKFSFDKQESGSWNKVLSNIKEFPSNAMVICDRYLFPKGKDVLSIENVNKLLDSILPKTFKSNYQVCIICNLFSSEEALKKISTQLNDCKIKLNRNYDIDFEILAVKEDDFSHNRRICSNYFWIMAEHKIAAFRYGKSDCSQTICINKLFDSSTKTFSIFGAEEQQKNIKNYSAVISKIKDGKFLEWKNGYGVYKYIRNSIDEDISKFENRLLEIKL